MSRRTWKWIIIQDEEDSPLTQSIGYANLSGLDLEWENESNYTIKSYDLPE